MTADTLTISIAQTPNGWTVRRSDGRELARFRGPGAKRRAQRYVWAIARG